MKPILKACFLISIAVATAIVLPSRLNADSPTAIQSVWLVPSNGEGGGQNAGRGIFVCWTTPEPASSMVRWGNAANALDCTADNTAAAQIHRVWIPAPKTGRTYYQVRSSCGKEAFESPVYSFKAFPENHLKIAIVGDWGYFSHARQMKTIVDLNPDLLVSVGDNVAKLWDDQTRGFGGERDDKGRKFGSAAENTAAYERLTAAYPEIFTAIPFLPILGNHDHEIRPRENKRNLEPGQPIPSDITYDWDATAFCRFFPLPDEGWRWKFALDDYSFRFVSLDMNHLSDRGTTFQTCHDFDEKSEQYRWFKSVTEAATEDFLVALYNSSNYNTRSCCGKIWESAFSPCSFCVTGFGYFAERAEVGSVTYYNTSLSGRGDRYPDPASQFFASENNFLWLDLDKEKKTVNVQIRSLEEGRVLDEKTFTPRK